MLLNYYKTNLEKCPSLFEFIIYSIKKLRRHAIFPTPSYVKKDIGGSKFEGLIGPTFPGIVLSLKHLYYSGVRFLY